MSIVSAARRLFCAAVCSRNVIVAFSSLAALSVGSRVVAQTSCIGGESSCGSWSPVYNWGSQINPGNCPIGEGYTEISHAALIPIGMHTGKVINWRRSLVPGTPCVGVATTEVWVFNPNNPAVLQVVVENLDSDIFCAGMSWDRNARLLVAGGFISGSGAPIEAYRFDPRLLGLAIEPWPGPGTPTILGDPWTVPFNMSHRRYYPTVFGLDRRPISASTGTGCPGSSFFAVPGGSQVVVGGPPSVTSNDGTEVWQFEDPAVFPDVANPWLHSLDSATGGSQTPTGTVELYQVAVTNPATEPRLDSYPRAYQLGDHTAGPASNGRSFVAFDIETVTMAPTQPNPPGESWVLRPPAATTHGCWDVIRGDNSEPLVRERHYAPTVLLHTITLKNRILAFGGSQPPTGGGTPWTSHGLVQEYDFLGMTAENGSWRDMTSLHFARVVSNAVALPMGRVLVIGGETIDVSHGGVWTGCDTAVFTPELYDPEASPADFGESRLMAADPTSTPRRYHSVAVLLLDGSVLMMGGHQRPFCVPSEHTGQIFFPPYFHNGTRPVIDAAPGSIDFLPGGSTFLVRATLYHNHVHRVVLLRPAAVTHHNDYDQRYIELDFTAPSYTPGATVALTVTPPNETLGPPGYYTLWVVESKTSSLNPDYKDLIPSTGKIVRLQ
jgi:hypothetical protein